MRKIRTFKSKDNVGYKFKIYSEPIILTESQINLIEAKMFELHSSEIENKGVTIHQDLDEFGGVTVEQGGQVFDLITDIFKSVGGNIESIIESEVIEHSNHSKERIDDKELVLNRNWESNNIDREIVQCLKRAFRVEQIRIKFNSESKENLPNYSYTIRGFKNEREDKDVREGRVVISFIASPDQEDVTILLITILQT